MKLRRWSLSRVMGASRCALRVLFFAMCRGLSAGFIVASPGCARPVVSRRIPACNAAVDLTESYGTLTALWGLLALVPLTRLDAKRLNKIERLEGTAAIAETAFGLLGSMTVFLTSRFELQHTTDDDVRLRVACAVVVVAAGTGATKAAFLAVNSRREAEKKKQSNDKFIPIVGIFLTFFLSFITLKG